MCGDGIDFRPKAKYTELTDAVLRDLVTKEELSSFDLLRVMRELCEGTITLKSLTTSLSLSRLMRRINNELQNARGTIAIDDFKRWWIAFVRFAGTSKPAVSAPTPAPAAPAVSAVQAVQTTPAAPAPAQPTLKTPPPLPAATIKSPQLASPTKESVFNSSRLSVASSEASWNEKWQELCDLCCGVNHVDSERGKAIAQKTCEYCEGVMREVEQMEETIFKRFLCPAEVRGCLNDGFSDHDSCFYSDDNSRIVIPFHVRAHLASHSQTFDPVNCINEYIAMSIVDECDYQWLLLLSLTRRSIKASSREFAQFHYILAHSGQEQGRLCVPSNLLIDICGFRFSVVSALPIRGESYIYNETTPAAQLTHRMPCLNPTAGYEVWKGVDNRDYIVSCKDLLAEDPLVLTPEDQPRCVRYEIADEYFGHSREQLGTELQRIVREVCTELETMEYPPASSPELSVFLHKRGVSIRHIGMIYAQTTKQWLKDLIYIEMLARTGKCILWKNLRCVIYNDKMEFDANVKSHAENGKASVDQNYRKTQWGVVTSRLVVRVDHRGRDHLPQLPSLLHADQHHLLERSAPASPLSPLGLSAVRALQVPRGHRAPPLRVQPVGTPHCTVLSVRAGAEPHGRGATVPELLSVRRAAGQVTSHPREGSAAALVVLRRRSDAG